MSIKARFATEKFLSGYNCAQSILYAFREESGLSEEIALKIGCGLGAGVNSQQN